MRILTLSNYYPPYLIGGYEIACKEMMDYLESKGHIVHVITSVHMKQSTTTSNIDRTMQLIDYNKPSILDKCIVEHHNYNVVSDAIDAFKPDLVYIWSLRGIGMSAVQAVDAKQVPKIFEIGDFWMKGFLRDSLSFKLKQFVKSLIPFTYTKKIPLEPNICVSHWVAEEMKNKYKTTQNYVFPNSINIPDQFYEKNNNSMHFIYTGRIDVNKGLDIAISALIEFNFIYPNEEFIFDIYGTGDESYIQQCKKLSQPIKDKVVFHGYSNNREKMYETSDVLLMPTKMREAFGLVIIEAMAHGCCVIATDAYGPAEIIQHNINGLLFRPGSVSDLLKNILYLHSELEITERLKVTGYKYVKNNYNIDYTKPKIEKLLQSLVKDVL